MAPTETLAEQHAATARPAAGRASRDPVRAADRAPRRAAARAARRSPASPSGELGLVVGTHALIEPDVELRPARASASSTSSTASASRQRAALDAKGPDGRGAARLHMTATPIPRTLSLTAYGDLDATALRELPAGPQPVETWVVGEEKRAGAYEFIRERLREGRQAYVVCPLVDELARSCEAQGGRAEEAERLRAGEFARLRGRPPARPDAGARQGRRRWRRSPPGETDVLVATSVIEVGIDVANATVMLIEGAERYGLSQLHQLRGRVGRGEHASHCILFADAGSELARRRLEAIEAERDGFKLAEVDLALRGEGEILGTRQHGLPRFRVAELPEDVGAPDRGARARCSRCSSRHGSLDAPELGPLLDAARRRFGDERAEPIAGTERDAGRRRRAQGPPPASPPRGRQPCGRPPTGCARRCSRSSATVDGATRPRPLLRHRGARRSRRSRAARPRHAGRHATSRWRGATSRELGLASRVRGRPRRRAPLPAARRGGGFDLIFCDPPYRLADRLEAELDSLIPARPRGGRARDRRERRPPPARARSLPLLAERRYGDTLIRIHAGGDSMSDGRTADLPGQLRPGHQRPPRHHRAAPRSVFDRVVVGVVNQPVRKQTTLFTAEERQAFLDEATAGPRRTSRSRSSPTSWSSSPASTARPRSSRACGRSPTSSTSSR